jgi:hypothetical protein
MQSRCGGRGGWNIPATKSILPFFVKCIIDMETKELNLLKLETSKNNMETEILSESVLAKDWLSPEEDEAWKKL